MNWKKRIKRKHIVLSIIIIACLSIYYYRHKTSKEEVMYITAEVKRTNINKTISATGEVIVNNLTDVGAQVSGKIEKLYVVLGQEVKKGDMIAQIDSTTQQNEVDMNKAKLQTYRAQLKAYKISLKVAKSKYERGQKLIKVNAISKESFEDLENDYELAKAKITELESLINQTEISLSTAETNLGYTKINAPIDGTIVSVPVKEGQTVNSGLSTPTIVQIANLNEVEILMEISEGDITNITTGIKVDYSVLGDETTYTTTLKTIDPALTLLTNDNYTGIVGSSEAIYYYGRLVVPNKDRKLRIGMTTQNTIYVADAEDVLAVPSVAIYTKDNGIKCVKILKDDNTVEEKVIRTGITDNIMTEIKGGLYGGEKVVISQLTASEAKEKAKNGMPRRR